MNDTDQLPRLKIAIVAPPWYPIPPPAYGGIESLCHLLVEGLVERGHEVTLVGVDRPQTSARYISTYDRAQGARIGQSFPEVVHAAGEARSLEGLDIDLVHDHSLAGPLLAFNRSIPTVVTAHGPVDGEIGEYYRLLSSHVSMVAISNAQRHMAPDLPWVETIYNAIEVDDYPFSTDKDDFLLWLGRTNPDKGAHLAIDIARDIGERIVLAGKCTEPEEKHYFEEEIAPRLGPGVEWTGEADAERKKVLLSQTKCLLFPLQWPEPFGIVMAEAMACGTPVVALNEGSVPEVVENGVTGFVCDEIEAMPEALGHTVEIDPHACRKRVEALFNTSVMVSAYESVFARTVAQRVAYPTHRR
jgi:glycosyltransferase involved in cell wall biosynthesis